MGLSHLADNHTKTITIQYSTLLHTYVVLVHFKKGTMRKSTYILLYLYLQYIQCDVCTPKLVIKVIESGIYSTVQYILIRGAQT